MDGSKYRISDFSSQSVIRCVDNFVRTVDTMNETIMVPSRLLNVELPENHENIPDLLRGSSDPYTFYTVLNNMRNSVVWGHSQTDDDEEDDRTCEDPLSSAWMSTHKEKSIPKLNKYTTATTSANTTVAPLKGESEKRHVRRTSSISMASVTSSSSDCSERLSDTGDSGVDEEVMEPVDQVTSSLKMHMQGLHNCLTRLTETANFITELYQEEVKV